MLLIMWVLLRVLFSSGGSGLVAGLKRKKLREKKLTERSVERILKRRKKSDFFFFD